jgi:regulator of nucleoside diphosphate kinase
MAKRANGAKSMDRRAIYVAHEDRVRLEGLRRRATADNAHEARYLAALAGELARAQVMPRARIPPCVVTMYSAIRLRDLETGDEETYTLVFPEEADINENKLSVLAPVGTALLGYQAGDVVEWPVPAGLRRFRIKEVFPPEPALLRDAW